MDTMQAYAIAQANLGREQMVFDWQKAARLIMEHQPRVASAGLSQDWEWTGGEIWRDGKPVPREETYVYLASTWATPELDLDDEIFECFCMKSSTPGWDSDTYWPPEALEIINGK